MAAVRWILKFNKYYCLTWSRGPSHISVPNFVKKTKAVNLLRIYCDFFFKMAASPEFVWGIFDHLWRVLGVLYHRAKFDYDDEVVLIK